MTQAMSRADATKARILQAATDEFATYGIAGARVDRIAKTAGANKNLIYIYFGGKDQLFDVVIDAHVTHGLNSVPFTPDDLPEYAGRLATWHRLERGDRDLVGAAPARDAKLDALAAAQKKDGFGSEFSPTTLLTLVLSMALAWSPSNVTSVPPGSFEAETAADHRRAIVEAVRRLL